MSKWKNLNPKPLPFFDDGINPSPQIPFHKPIAVQGRKEHEAVIKSAEKCKELGVDQIYETMVYLKRWGGWLNE